MHAFYCFSGPIKKTSDVEKFVYSVLLDFPKTFDKFDHDILLASLPDFGLRGVPRLWFQSYQ